MMPQAIVKGGLHGRPRGLLSGIVYSSARSRTGKIVTAREYVIPGEITDQDVLDQRILFKQAVYACRYLGSGLWANDFNRAVGQLPGFHSMMSIICLATDRETFNLGEPPDTPLGSLYAPTVTFTQHGSTAGSITATWSGYLGLNGTDADVLNFFGIEVIGSEEGIRSAVDWATSAVRSDLTIDIPTGSSTTDWIAAVYFQGAGTAEGKLSRCQWHAVTSL